MSNRSGQGGAGHKPRGTQARKRFSQNFLVDRGIIDRIVRSVAAGGDDEILEIGPGRGALTSGLLAASPLVTAVEIDRDLARSLRAELPELVLIDGDILKVSVTDIARRGADQSRPWNVVGNLPYNISTPVIFHLLGQADAITAMTFMLQDEVVQRLAAQPGSKAWGRLSVMVQYRCEVTPLFDVPKECFSPRPKIHSRMVRLTPVTPQRRPKSEAMMDRIVRLAFSARRKTLRNALKTLTDDVFEHISFDGSRRGDTLSVAEFIDLSDLVLDYLGGELGGEV